MAVRQPNSTNYTHPDEPNLVNLHKAMEYNGLGQPIIRTSGAGGGTGSTDAFGRARTAQPHTLFDSQQRFSENNKFFTITTGTGASSHDANNSLVNMSVTGAGSVVRETRQVFTYQPGKALEIFNTFTMDAAPDTGVTQRVGYFGQQNGVYLEYANGVVYAVLRSFSTGSVVENRVPQSDWNGDKLDGTGLTALTLDISKSQILFIDIEWLGVGSVRVGFVINGVVVIAHTFHHANSITGTYMTTATLPIRYEITSTGPAATLKHICNTVISSGGFEPTGASQSRGRGLTYINIASSGTYYHLATLRLQSTRLDDVAILTDINVMTGDNHNLLIKLVRNATFDVPLTWSPNESVETSITNATVVDEGECLLVGYVIKGGKAEFDKEELKKLQLTRSPDADTYSIIVTSDNNNTSAAGNFSWMEPLHG